MATPITVEMALKNLPALVHPIFERVCEKYLQPNERIYHSAYCTIIRQIWSTDDQEWHPWHNRGVITVTDYRFIVGQFHWGGNDRVTFHQSNRTKAHQWLGENPFQWKWILPPPPGDLPDLNKLGREKWGSKIDETFHEMPLVYQEKIKYKEYHVQLKGTPIDLCVLTLAYNKGRDDWYEVVLLHNDGKKLYGLLQEALQNRGRLAPQQPTQAATSKPVFADDPVATLAKLKRMLDQNLITEAEYQAKKSEVLSRM